MAAAAVDEDTSSSSSSSSSSDQDDSGNESSGSENSEPSRGPLSPPPLSEEDSEEEDEPGSKRERGPADLIELARRASQFTQIENYIQNHKIEVNAQVKAMGNWTALIAASREGHLFVAKRLLEMDADPNLEDVHGWTALMYAAYKGHRSICELLCDEWNADALATDKHRHMRASKWAYMAGHKALGEYLRKVQRRQVGPRKTYYKDHHEKLKPPRFKAQKPFVTKYPNVPRKCFCQNMPKPCSRCRKPEKWPHQYTPRKLK
eukprot:g5432.t1